MMLEPRDLLEWWWWWIEIELKQNPQSEWSDTVKYLPP